MSEHTASPLQHTRNTLLSGDLSQLPTLVAQTEDLVRQLPLGGDVKMLRELRKQAQRNLHLLDAARRGFKDAQDRRRQIEDVAQGLKTYNRSGSFRPQSRPGMLERKS